MEKLKEFLSKNWIPIILISILIALAVFNAIDNHLSYKTNKLVAQVEFNKWKLHYQDSIKLTLLKTDSINLDSIKQADAAKTNYHLKRANLLQVVVNSQQKEIKALQQKANTNISNYQTGATTAECDSAISGLLRVINKQNIATDSLQSQSNQFNQTAEGYKKQLYDSDLQLINKQKEIFIKDNSLSESNRINQQLLKQISQNDNWWRRNEKWFYFGGGAVSIAGLAYLLKK